MSEDHLLFAHSRGDLVSRRCAFKCLQCCSVVRRHANDVGGTTSDHPGLRKKHQVRDVSRLHISHVNASALL